MFGFVIYTGRSLFKPENDDSDEFVEKIGGLFVVSCIANCAWIVTWLYGYTGISVLVLVVALISLLMILLEALKYNNGVAERWFIRIPFQIYAGWVSVALIAATAAWLTKIDWNRFGISEVNWTIILIGIASLIHLFMTWKKNAPIFALVAVWALIAIAVANREISSVIYLTALIAAGILFVSSMIKIFVKREEVD